MQVVTPANKDSYRKSTVTPHLETAISLLLIILTLLPQPTFKKLPISIAK